MVYIIYSKYLIINSRNSIYISKLTDFINDLKKLSNFEFKKGFWEFLEQIIDHNNCFNLNRNLDQYKIKDVISNLFDVFRNIKSFCISSILTFKCKKHLPQGDIMKNISEPLLNVGVGELKLYYTIEEFILDKYNYSNSACPNCDYIEGKILDKSAEYFYSNIKLPSIISFELVFDNLNDLKTNIDDITKIFITDITIFKCNYNLKGIICLPTDNHYTLYLHQVNENDLDLEISLNYYYNGLFHDGEIENYTKTLFELISSKNGFIFIYEKQN